MSDCCREYTRSELLNRSAARAGAGLPSIEPGMPAPAGTGMSRRGFVLRSAGVALSVYGASRLSPDAFEAGVAAAQSAPAQPVLVSVYLSGGIDGLSVLAPVGESNYKTLRPTLALAPDGLAKFTPDERLAWAPGAAGVAELFGEGKVTVLPALGYDQPDQSHFTSRHFYEVGELNPQGRIGWLGRYLDRAGAKDNPMQGLSLDSYLSPQLATAGTPVASVESPDSYRFDTSQVNEPVKAAQLGAFGRLGTLPTADPVLAQAREQQQAASTLRTQLSAFSVVQPPVAYPANNRFGSKLAALAAMLGAGLPLRCVTVQAPGGYDTHANQAGSLGNNLKATCDALLAFQRDLEARGLADRVLTEVWSEFGRRAKENGSAGTDHGAAGVGFVIGARAAGGMVGEFPGLGTSGIDRQGNLRATSDFRAMYCGLVEQWLGTDAAGVVPGAENFARPVLVK